MADDAESKPSHSVHSGGTDNSLKTFASSTSASVSVPVSTDLESFIECPVCYNYVFPPIRKCENGHVTCSSCHPKVTCCPICKVDLGDIPNLSMEKSASAVLLCCKYSMFGCTMSLHHPQNIEHEELCEHRPYSCPYPSAYCEWQGALEQVMPHLMLAQERITKQQGEDITFIADINDPGARNWVMIQKLFGPNFMIVLEKQDKDNGHQQFFAKVQLIGSRERARHFRYRLELNGSFILAARTSSIREDSILESGTCVIDTATMQEYATTHFFQLNVLTKHFKLIIIHVRQLYINKYLFQN